MATNYVILRSIGNRNFVTVDGNGRSGESGEFGYCYFLSGPSFRRREPFQTYEGYLTLVDAQRAMEEHEASDPGLNHQPHIFELLPGKSPDLAEPKWAVSVMLTEHDRYAVAVWNKAKDAFKEARARAKAGSKQVRVNRLVTEQDLYNAETQVIKVEDWESDAPDCD
jgi:hypothetical protein